MSAAGIRQTDYDLDAEGQTCDFPLDAVMMREGDSIRVRYPYRIGTPLPLPDTVAYSSEWRGLVVSEFDGPTGTGREAVDFIDSSWPMVKLPVGKNDAFPSPIVDDETWLPVVPNGTAIEFTQSIWLRRELTQPVRLHFRMDGYVRVFLDGVLVGSLNGQSASDPKDERPNAGTDGTGGAVPIPFDVGPGLLAVWMQRQVRAGYDGHYLDIETEELP